MSIALAQVETLLQAARQAAEKAYAPYSNFPVGAALLTADGTVITGVNVENASFGLTLCAERAALVKAVSDGHRQFQGIAVWASRRPHGSVTLCGACRQVLAEFFAMATPIWFQDQVTGKLCSKTIGELLPEAFGPAFQGSSLVGTGD